MNRNPAVVSAVRTSDRAYYGQVGDSETLDHAVVRFSTQYPAAAPLHFATEVLIERAAEAGAALGAIHDFFAGRGQRCGWLAPCAAQPAGVLDAVLGAEGYVCETHLAWQAPPASAEAVPSGLRLLPARAMRRAATVVLRERWAGHAGGDELVAAWLDRLDDAQYDARVALEGDEPLGYGALHQVGEIGRVRDVFVRAAHRRRGVASVIIRQVLDDARRWGLRPVCAALPATNRAAIALLERLGFEPAGELTRYRAAGSDEEPE